MHNIAIDSDWIHHRRPAQHETGAALCQSDPWLARDMLSDAKLFYWHVQYLCVTPQIFEQLKSMSTACMAEFRAEGPDTDARALALRAVFENAQFGNVAAALFLCFPNYADRRRVNARFLRFPLLPPPQQGTPEYHWAHTIADALKELPAGCMKDLKTCAYSYFYAFAGYEALPKSPAWIANALVPAEADAGEGQNNPNIEPQI